jgi:hypothetical protein
MSDSENFLKLDDFQGKSFFSTVAEVIFGCFHDQFFEFSVNLGFDVNFGEKIVNKTEENGFIVSNDFRDVEISKSSHEQWVFRNLRIRSLKFTGLSQDGLHCSKTPIVMSGLGQKLSTEHVQGNELFR